MITIKDFMTVINYRITEGSQFGWNCYGSNAYSLDSWSEDNDDGYGVGIVFDTVTQEVYEMSVCDYKNQRAYRLINPDYRENYQNTARDWNANSSQAWDDVEYVDLETDEDMLEKAQAIVDGRDYDTRVRVEVELSDNDLFDIMRQAHEHDVTLNDYINRVLADEVNRMKRNEQLG